MMTRSAVFVFLMLLLAGAVQAVEREHPAKAKVIQVDRDQKVLSLTVDDATVEVGDLFVVLREPDHAGIPEKNLAVIGIESIGKDQAVGKVLFGTMPSVGAVSKRFYGIPAVFTDRVGDPTPVTPALKARFPDLCGGTSQRRQTMCHWCAFKLPGEVKPLRPTITPGWSASYRPMLKHIG